MNIIILSIPIFFLLIGIELLYDRIRKKNLYRFNDSFSNISCGITEQVSGVFAKVFTVAAYDVIYQNFRLMDIPGTWYWWIVAFIGVDFFYYWAHRMSHQVNLFWAGHVVHHQSEEYNLSVALRQGAFQKIFTFYFYFPLALLGFSTTWFLTISAVNLLYQFWIHTEAIKRMPVFEWVFNTPSHHRVHHGRDPKYIDKNHGGTFIIWDRLFGTFQDEEERPNYGITKPLNSFNPVFAQVSHLINVFRDLFRMKNIGEAWKLLWSKPGWRPERLGGLSSIPEVGSDYQKFEVPLSGRGNIYLFVQYLVSLGITSLFLFTQANMTWDLKIILTIWIFVSVGSLGVIFNAKFYSDTLETIRISGTLLAILCLSYFGLLPFVFSMMLLAFFSLSLFWFLALRKDKSKINEA